MTVVSPGAWIAFTTPDDVRHLIGQRIDIRQPGTEHAVGFKSEAVHIATGFSDGGKPNYDGRPNWLEFMTDGRDEGDEAIGPFGGWQVRAHTADAAIVLTPEVSR